MRSRIEARAWHETADGILIRFHLTPRASKDAVEGVRATAGGPAFKARVRAAPQSGEANRALEALVARWLQVPKSVVSVAGGSKSRTKSVRVVGDGLALRELLDAKSRDSQ
jgi:uncharacterized protein YggU (UPF0235/DUF167 family)